MTATMEAPVALPFTTSCSLTGNFSGEYSESLRWKCSRYDGHTGDCVPSELDQRMHARRLKMRAYHNVPEEAHLDAEALRIVVNIATSEASDSDGLDSGVMWLRIRQYLSFVTYLRLVCP